MTIFWGKPTSQPIHSPSRLIHTIRFPNLYPIQLLLDLPDLILVPLLGTSRQTNVTEPTLGTTTGITISPSANIHRRYAFNLSSWNSPYADEKLRKTNETFLASLEGLGNESMKSRRAGTSSSGGGGDSPTSTRFTRLKVCEHVLPPKVSEAGKEYLPDIRITQLHFVVHQKEEGKEEAVEEKEYEGKDGSGLGDKDEAKREASGSRY
ncbi:hypothetical protein K435DRAFT_862490 [Dendrothele bispora CBS 962.96]|uniref:Uncharacterized protein n=1 Tax=Dendrothele bispora (strain CBS 962.96) TaxID=1314807 RepID=A0A4S8LSB5_DENBC|nr:hypothetical protein K435DRAFT_862490 [Dendrothele bispora CBS 962.96]